MTHHLLRSLLWAGLRGRRRRTVPAGSAWPDDGAWVASARLSPGTQIDAGFAVTSHVPSWMLAIDAPDDASVVLPDLPQVLGHVLTADAMGHAAELIARLPPLPDRARRRETAAFCSLGVNLLLRPPEQEPVLVEMFAGSWKAAGALLDALADVQTPAGKLYDNLDQGWALRILVEREAVLVLKWNWEAADPRQEARALRLPRRDLAVQAAAARRQLDHLHAALAAALGRDLWFYPALD
ncbi:MAG: hypothetical protein ACRYF2_12805 [Janthinobacterium lividum]